MRKLVFCTSTLTAAAFSPLLALAGAGAPRVGEPALVVSLPWRIGASEAVRAAGLAEIAPVAAHFGTLTALEHPEDADALKHLGIWLVLDGRKVYELCGI